MTTWINEHPAIASELRGMPRGVVSLKTWANDRRYRDPWVSSPALDAKLAQVRQALAFESPTSIVHLHVFGRPGIGKSRFVLQACQGATWNKSVLYVPQWADADIAGLLAAAAQAGAGRLVLVVDEVPPERVKALDLYASDGADRIRVITIGHHESPDGGTIAQLEVEPLDDGTMAKLIEAAHPTLPSEHVRYVVSFAGGYKHQEDGAAPMSTWTIDWFSSAAMFPGWAEYGEEAFLWRGPQTYDPLVVYQPKTWLLREGWKKAGSISCREVPSAKR